MKKPEMISIDNLDLSTESGEEELKRILVHNNLCMDWENWLREFLPRGEELKDIISKAIIKCRGLYNESLELETVFVVYEINKRIKGG